MGKRWQTRSRGTPDPSASWAFAECERGLYVLRCLPPLPQVLKRIAPLGHEHARENATDREKVGRRTAGFQDGSWGRVQRPPRTKQSLDVLESCAVKSFAMPKSAKYSWRPLIKVLDGLV